MECSCDVTSSPPGRTGGEEVSDRNRNYELTEDSSHEQQRMLGRDRASDASLSFHRDHHNHHHHHHHHHHQPTARSPHLERRLSVPSNSSAFDVINPLPRLPVSGEVSPTSPQSVVLSESYPPAKNVLGHCGYLQTTPTDLSLRPRGGRPTQPFWTYHDLLTAKQTFLFWPTNANSSAGKDESVPFHEFFEQFRLNMARINVADSSSAKTKDSQPQTTPNSLEVTSEVDDSQSMSVDEEERESSPLNLKTDTSHGKVESGEDQSDEHHENDVSSDSSSDDRKETPQNFFPETMSSSVPVTSSLSSSLSFLQQLGGGGGGGGGSVGGGRHASPQLLLGFQPPPSSPLLSHPSLYPALPDSYPMTSLAAAAAHAASPRLVSLLGPAFQDPHSTLLSVLGSGVPSSQGFPRGSQSSPAGRGVSGVPHPGLGFYPAGFAVGGAGEGGGRRGSVVEKAPVVKKYKCDVCDKAFSRSNTLVTHKRIHTGDKPFSCEQCGRAFRQPGNLTRHRLTHTTHKPYVCVHCNKAFNRASNLNTHMRIHNIRSFSCHFCQRHFPTKNDLRHHMFSHGEQGPSLAAMLRQ